METNILLVEDEESVNRGIEFTLKKEGYKIFACRNIREAKKVFQEEKIAVILCDIHLPDGSGLDFIKEIRSQSNVHIICLTALDQETDQVMGYEAGADDYITKPFSLSVLSLKLKAYFGKKEENKERSIVSGGIEFHKKEMKLYRGGEEVALTKNEWKLLLLFLEHPKQILSKKQLLYQLFDIDEAFVEANTIAVNIRRLREKIEEDAKNPEYIKNIRGIGYIWDKECTSQ